MALDLRQRPIFGGVFGMRGDYALATVPCVSRGLHAVRYLVIDPRVGAVLAIAERKAEALEEARQLLRASAPLSDDASWQQSKLWPEEATPQAAPHVVRPVSRRRREIFDKSAGRCHYCRTPLTLDGQWHIEHMLPRALNGGDALGNLVASCPPCNLAKGDRTALEFVAATAASLPAHGAQGWS